MKPKTKKQKLDFKSGIYSVLQSHGIDLDDSVREPLMEDMVEFITSTFKPDNSTPFWSELVSQWMAFYFEVTGEKAEFTPIEAINLKRISKTLRRRYMDAIVNGIWDSNTCLTQHLLYYTNAITIDFYKQSLSLTILYSKFNEITARLSAIRKKEKEMMK